jgi:uncharacterized protein (TIGR02145 family)
MDASYNYYECIKPNYGRLYDLATAKIACPSGWHLPNNDDWDTLMIAIGGYSTAGKYLKTREGWAIGNGTDTYGFSALPGGSGNYYCGMTMNDYGYLVNRCGSTYHGIGSSGLWWSSGNNDNSRFYYLYTSYYEYANLEHGYNANNNIDSNKNYYSVRCIKN